MFKKMHFLHACASVLVNYKKTEGRSLMHNAMYDLLNGPVLIFGFQRYNVDTVGR